MELSAVIVSYNVRELLRGALQSLIAAAPLTWARWLQRNFKPQGLLNKWMRSIVSKEQ